MRVGTFQRKFTCPPLMVCIPHFCERMIDMENNTERRTVVYGGCIFNVPDHLATSFSPGPWLDISTVMWQRASALDLFSGEN